MNGGDVAWPRKYPNFLIAFSGLHFGKVTKHVIYTRVFGQQTGTNFTVQYYGNYRNNTT